MLSMKCSLFLRWSVVFGLQLVLLIPEISNLDPEEKRASQTPEPVDARLAGGERLCSGRLEMRYNRQWRALDVAHKDSNKKLNYAEVACRQMGCGFVVSIAENTNKTDQRPAWRAGFTCTGTEAVYSSCHADGRRWNRVEDRQTSESVVEVTCSETLKFEGSQCRGRVKVKSDQGWIQVCKDGFDSEAEKVFCRELGCGPPTPFPGPTNVEAEPVLSKEFRCKGNESRLQDCASSIRTDCRPALGVSCSLYDVRLVGGESRCKGRLEGRKDGEWRPLNDAWSLVKPKHYAEVCLHLGCAEFISSSTSRLPTSQPVWELSPQCDRSDSSLCKLWMRSKSSSVINMACSDSLRLDGHKRCLGKLKVKHGRSWVPVCSSFFTPKDAVVVCRELECGFPDADYDDWYDSYFQEKERIWDPVFNCKGDEKHLLDCPITTLNVTIKERSKCFRTSLTCTELPPPPVITVYSSQGNLSKDSPVVFIGQRFAISCRAFSPYYNVLSIRLKSGVGTERESEQIQSPVDGEAVFMFPVAEDYHEGDYRCDYNYDFGLKNFSQPKTFFLTVKEHSETFVRLVNGDSRCAGGLELNHQEEWRPVSYQHSWSLKEAAVLCRQLNCGSAVSTSKVDNSTIPLPAWRFYSDCDGSERALVDCGTVKEWLSSSTVEVVCSDTLLQPEIAVYSMSVGLDDVLQEVPLSKGHSFGIVCSVEPQYPGGHFSLVFTGLNQNHSRIQPAVNHSAYFAYNAADETHQGNYSCVYHNFVFNHNLTSESRSRSLVISSDIKEVRLDNEALGESESCAGKLSVYEKNEWRHLSPDSTVWDLNHASLVCRQLGCGSAVSTKERDLPVRKPAAWRFFSDCDGSENSLLDCGSVEKWFSTSAIEVVCTGHRGTADKN